MKLGILRKIMVCAITAAMVIGLWTVPAGAVEPVPVKPANAVDYSNGTYTFSKLSWANASYNASTKTISGNTGGNRMSCAEVFFPDLNAESEVYYADFDVSFPVDGVDFTNWSAKAHKLGIILGTAGEYAYKLFFRINGSDDIMLCYANDDQRTGFSPSVSLYGKRIFDANATAGTFCQSSGLSALLQSDGTNYSMHVVTKLDLVNQTTSVWINDTQVFDNASTKGSTGAATFGDVASPTFGFDLTSPSTTDYINPQIKINALYGTETLPTAPSKPAGILDYSDDAATFNAAWVNTATYNASTKTISGNTAAAGGNNNSIAELYFERVTAITDVYTADFDITFPTDAVDFGGDKNHALGILLGSAGDYAYKIWFRMNASNDILLGYSSDSTGRPMSTAFTGKRIMGISTAAGTYYQKSGLSNYIVSDGTTSTMHVVAILNLTNQTLTLWINNYKIFDNANTKGSGNASTYGNVANPGFGVDVESAIKTYILNPQIKINALYGTEKDDKYYDGTYPDLSNDTTFYGGWWMTAAYDQSTKTITGNVNGTNSNSISELYMNGIERITKNYYVDLDLSIPVSAIGPDDNRNHNVALVLGTVGDTTYQLRFRFLNKDRETHFSDLIACYGGGAARTELGGLLYEKKLLDWTGSSSEIWNQYANAINLFENDGTNYKAHVVIKMDIENQTITAIINGVSVLSNPKLKGASDTVGVTPAFGLVMYGTVISPTIKINHVWTNEVLPEVIAVPALKAASFTADGLTHSLESLVTGFDSAKMTAAITKAGSPAEVKDAGEYTIAFTAKEGYTFNGAASDLVLTVNAPETPVVSGSEKAEMSLQLEVGETITANFIVSVDDPSNYTSVYLNARVGGGDYRKLEATPVGGVYTFVYTNIYSQNMNDVIEAQVIGVTAGGTEVLDEITAAQAFTIATYCEAINTAFAEDEVLNTFIANMLSYGAAAQQYVSHNTGALADAGAWVASAKKAYTMTDTEADAVKVECTVPAANASAYKVRSAFLRVGQKIELIFKVFTTSSDIKVKLSAPGIAERILSVSDLAADVEANTYQLSVGELLPQEYDRTYTVSVVDGTNTDTVYHSIAYSAYTYLYAKRADNDAKLAAFVQAIYDYSRAAIDYVSR